jgi:hypothetical protein
VESEEDFIANEKIAPFPGLKEVKNKPMSKGRKIAKKKPIRKKDGDNAK